MNVRSPTRALLLPFALTAAAASQTATPPADGAIPPSLPKAVHHAHRPAASPAPVQNLNLVLLDPAHGGSDPGAKLAPNLLEKDVTLAFAQRLRSVLAARGFSVELTRETDGAAPPAATANQPAPSPAPQLTLDARAEQASRLHPLACLILHATAAGRGVHLYTSALTAVPPVAPGTPDAERPIQLWDDVQAPLLPQSRKLSADLAQAVRNGGMPLLTGASSVNPIDSLSCPALLIEIAPLGSGRSLTEPNDAAYQDRLARSIAEALIGFRSQLQSAQPTATPPLALGAPAGSTPQPAPRPKPKPKPKPATPAPGTPSAAPTAHEPAQPAPLNPPKGDAAR